MKTSRKVQKFTLFLLSFVIFLASSCTMKRTLLEYIGVEKNSSSKERLFTFPENHKSGLLLADICASSSGSWDGEGKLMAPAQAKAPLLLFFAFFFFPWMIIGKGINKIAYPPLFHQSFSPKVPIYLKLGQLVYYS